MLLNTPPQRKNTPPLRSPRLSSTAHSPLSSFSASAAPDFSASAALLFPSSSHYMLLHQVSLLLLLLCFSFIIPLSAAAPGAPGFSVSAFPSSSHSLLLLQQISLLLLLLLCFSFIIPLSAVCSLADSSLILCCSVGAALPFFQTRVLVLFLSRRSVQLLLLAAPTSLTSRFLVSATSLYELVQPASLTETLFSFILPDLSTRNAFLDAIESPSTYPVSGWVSE